MITFLVIYGINIDSKKYILSLFFYEDKDTCIADFIAGGVIVTV